MHVATYNVPDTSLGQHELCLISFLRIISALDMAALSPPSHLVPTPLTRCSTTMFTRFLSGQRRSSLHRASLVPPNVATAGSRYSEDAINKRHAYTQRTLVFATSVHLWNSIHCPLVDRKQRYDTIPYSNCSQSIKDSWLVSSSTHVPTQNAKSLTPLFRGDSEIWAR